MFVDPPRQIDDMYIPNNLLTPGWSWHGTTCTTSTTVVNGARRCVASIKSVDGICRCAGAHRAHFDYERPPRTYAQIPTQIKPQQVEHHGPQMPEQTIVLPGLSDTHDQMDREQRSEEAQIHNDDDAPIDHDDSDLQYPTPDPTPKRATTHQRQEHPQALLSDSWSSLDTPVQELNRFVQYHNGMRSASEASGVAPPFSDMRRK